MQATIWHYIYMAKGLMINKVEGLSWLIIICSMDQNTRKNAILMEKTKDDE